MIKLNVNGKQYDVDVDPDTPLLWAIRDGIGLVQ
jgi:isoquinoline 1-oxidoreductase alpha subunit